MTPNLEQLCRETARAVLPGYMPGDSAILNSGKTCGEERMEWAAGEIAKFLHRAAPLLPEVIAAREALEEIRDTSKDVLFPAINKLLTEHGLTIKTDFVEQYRISNAHAKVDAALAGLRAMEGKG